MNDEHVRNIDGLVKDVPPFPFMAKQPTGSLVSVTPGFSQVFQNHESGRNRLKRFPKHHVNLGTWLKLRCELEGKQP